MGCGSEDVASLPTVRVRCAGVRRHERRSAVSQADRVFFSEAQFASSPYLVQVSFDCVSFVHRGSNVVERRFQFPGRVLHAVLAEFSAQASHVSSSEDSSSVQSTKRHRKAAIKPRVHPHLCVLVRSDCLNVYTAAGEVFEVALPFQANKLLPMENGRGLLLQRSPAVQIPSTPSKKPRGEAAAVLSRKNRRASTSNRGDGDRYNYSSKQTGEATRPRYFTLRHPLDEVKPVALEVKSGLLQTEKTEEAFLSDSGLEAVVMLDDGTSPILVVFHKWEQRYFVYRLMKMPLKRSTRPQVRVVDGPTWMKYRLKSEQEEFRIRIEPVWMAMPSWRSPRVGASMTKPMLLSPISSQPSSGDASPVPPSPQLTMPLLTPSGETSKEAFLASDMNGLPLLCMMDKDAGTLFLRQVSVGHIEESSYQTLHCRDAVPIRQRSKSWVLDGDQELQINDAAADIVVLRKDGNLVLYRANTPICGLLLPADDTDGNSAGHTSPRIRLPGNVHLKSIEAGFAYEIVFPDLCGDLGGKLWRCEHPFKIMGLPLLQQVFEVLEDTLPSSPLSIFKAQLIHRAQGKTEAAAGEGEPTYGGFEWQSFYDCVDDLLQRYIEGQNNELVSSHTEMSVVDDAVSSSASSFDRMCQDEYHDLYQYEHAMLFATMELPAGKRLNQISQRHNQENIRDTEQVLPGLHDYVETIFAGLHLLCEDLKLSVTQYRSRLLLAKLLLDIAKRLRFDPFISYYEQDNCILSLSTPSPASSNWQKTREHGLLHFVEYGCVPDLNRWLEYRMRGEAPGTAQFPVLKGISHQNQLSTAWQQREPLQRTVAVCRIYEILFPKSMDDTQTDNHPTSSAYDLLVYLTQDPVGSALQLDDLPTGLSFPIVQAIRSVKHHPPPSITEDICAFIGREDLSLSNVEYLSTNLDPSHTTQNNNSKLKEGESIITSEEEGHEDGDGLDEIIMRSQPLFRVDQRMKEVARLLRSSRPLCLKLEKQPDLSDLDYAQQQQARLLLLCKRSMSLSVARGMVTLGSFDISAAQTHVWQLRVPALPLTGRKPPTNAIVELDLSGYAKELTYWPQFHNGCATGLRLPAHDLSGVINRHWIKYHRPLVGGSSHRNSPGASGGRQLPTSQSLDPSGRNLEESYASHAGLLLGIGLRGHLKCLSMADVYNYLSQSNEFVTVAIMLGMASTAAHCRRKRKQQKEMAKPAGSEGVAERQSNSASQDVSSENADVELEADHLFSGFPELSASDNTPLLGTGLELALERSVSKMLCLHVPSLLPPPFAGFSVPTSTQTAALLGLGILYQGTGYRLMTELLLTEIARSPSSAQFLGNNSNAVLSTTSFDQLEGYSLSAGMALGLVVLGRGQSTTGDPGLADLKLEEKLHRYIIGGAHQYRDTNAPGSCLYRGRRWQAFGSGGSFSSAANGSATRSDSSNGSNGASPGVDRDAKYTHDRNNLRGGGEHVNTGVTACGAALALAFMYMQTNNKAVAAQLQVPDTLILLDYVRPDILLIRTLAKNLILWDEVTPTADWIETNEVPAQLLEAYMSIQAQATAGRDLSRPFNSSHDDLHSICESYANIVAGACMSIGLRFAGTSNVTARATLRKYFIHFRELRAKTSSTMLLRGSSNVVASSTERATVERCLAVCAQALALVDAGTGNVETLTLLRSVTLRQRVDAGMTYGNHMTLGMAIGLLFLGGGRATVSRSKEAIAALVISLYPMAPMNTADNKYHLQAFRHLYILAVDTSRLLEAVDVNSQTSCAVQVHVDLVSINDGSTAPGDMVQHKRQTLQTPCLLPDIASIVRLTIDDPGFYPVEILTAPSTDPRREMRSANTLRLDLLRNSNVVYLKRRQRQDGGGLANFTDELQQLHNLDVRAAQDSDDRLLDIFRSYFASSSSTEDEDGDYGENELTVADWGTGWWSSQLNSRALQFGREEAQLMLPQYLNVLHALFRLQQMPQLICATEVITLRLFSSYCRSHLYGLLPTESEHIGKERSYQKSSDPSVLVDFGVWLSNQTEEALRALCHRSSLEITSLASARVKLLAENTSSTRSTRETFLANVMIRYFAGPSAPLKVGGRQQLADQDWKSKFQRVLASCSQAQANSNSSFARFRLGLFLEQSEITEDEKIFWLKLVSFFLFSN